MFLKKIIIILIICILFILSLSCNVKRNKGENIEKKIFDENAKLYAPDEVSAFGLDNSIILNWKKVSNAASYNIYWGTTPELNKINSKKISGITANSYFHDSLNNGDIYYYIITAENSTKESNLSNEINSTPRKDFSLILNENFEDGNYDPGISKGYSGDFKSYPKIKSIKNFGSEKAFSFGISNKSERSENIFSYLKINFMESTYVSDILFNEIELNGNYGSNGIVYIDGKIQDEKFGRYPENNNETDKTYRIKNYAVNKYIKEIELNVKEITDVSEICIDDILITGINDCLKTNVHIKAGTYHNLVLKNDSMVWAWGNNIYGQLGDNSNINKDFPVQVSGLNNIIAISGGGNHSIALKNNGTVWTWGNNEFGQLGDNANINKNNPVQVSGLNDIIAITGGENHSLALKSNGTVWAWGNNEFGQLGDGTNINKNYPVKITGLNNIVAIACGGNHSLALKNNGNVWTWGDNKFGQLGDSTNIDRYNPVCVPQLDKIKAITGGGNFSIALKNEGIVWTWGNNVYNKSVPNKSVPVNISEIMNVNAIAGGASHSLALINDSSVWAWGNNGSGQLGDNSYSEALIPVKVYNFKNVIAIACGGSHSIALKSNGTIWAWGSNEYGQLGNNQYSKINYPVQIQDIEVLFAPADISAKASDQEITIKWSAESGLSYNIYWSENPDLNKTSGTKIPDVNSPYIHNGLINNTRYYYVVTSKKNNIESPESNKVSAVPNPIPSKPENVSAEADIELNIIRWSSELDIIYDIYWAEIPNLNKNNGRKITNVISPYIHTGLTSGIKYYYIVVAKKNDIESPDSNEVSAVPFKTLLIPANVRARAGDKQITILWDTTFGLTYNIYWSTSAGIDKNSSAKIANADSPYTHTGLTNGTKYYYVITAQKRNDESEKSAEVSVIPNPVPSAPVNLSAIGADKQITISWDISADLTYNIYCSQNTGVNKDNYDIKIPNVKSPYIHAKLTNEIKYYYIITAVKNNVESLESNEVYAIPFETPSEPANVYAQGDDKQIIIKWDMFDNLKYNIYWTQISGVNKNNSTKIPNVISPYIHTGLTNGVRYYYVITAENNYAESIISNEVNALAYPIPPKPVNLSLLAGEKEITIQWDTTAGLTYNIYWSLIAGVNKSSGTKISNIKAPYKHTGLTKNKTYYYVITAEINNMESLQSDEINAIPYEIPTKPVNLSVQVEDKEIIIRWDTTAGLIYNIYWSLIAGVNKSSGTKISNVKTPYNHTNLTNDTTYYYVVTALDNSRESIESNQVSAKPHSVYFSDNFENGLEKWTISGNNWNTITSDYYSATHSITESPSGDYPDDTNISITIKNSLDISYAFSPVLTFWHKYNTENNWDYAIVEVSKDGGATWTSIKEYTGILSSWTYVQLDLNSFKSSTLKIRFRLFSDGSYTRDGWYIDDVKIK